DTKFKITTNASYYKLTVNGRDLIELDFVNAVEKINGMDLASDLRRAMGL
ncbi:phage major tail tube protein, partial [Pandoraea pneumonica]